MRLYFDLARETIAFNRTAIESQLEQLSRHAPAGLQVCGGRESADWIIDPVGSHDLRTNPLRSDPTSADLRHRTLTWDMGDFPSGRRRGFYCSLDRRLFTPSRHRSLCYLIRYNPFITAFPLTDATQPWGFSGTITSGLRARLFRDLEPAARRDGARLRRTESLFQTMADPRSDSAKAAYAEDICRTQFVLCPRGNGVGSIRLFEVMEAGRVPVILSDRLVLPSCVNWPACSIRIAERDLARSPSILAARRDEFPKLARTARAEWERCFSSQNLLRTLAAEITTLTAGQEREPSMPRYLWFVLVLAGELQAKRVLRAFARARRSSPPAANQRSRRISAA